MPGLAKSFMFHGFGTATAPYIDTAFWTPSFANTSASAACLAASATGSNSIIATRVAAFIQGSLTDTSVTGGVTLFPLIYDADKAVTEIALEFPPASSGGPVSRSPDCCFSQRTFTQAVTLTVRVRIIH